MTTQTKATRPPSTSSLFTLAAPWPPQGDQPAAIEALVAGVQKGVKDQVLLGVTGSGKTFTMAHIIEKLQRPTLVMAHNKTLAAQLFQEFKLFFPDNAVEYFISYYDHYQPEAYVPSTDAYIAKSASVNDDIDAMRHSATRSLFERRDVIIVSSVSCIYGLGTPETYLTSRLLLHTGMPLDRNTFLRQLVALQYQRNDIATERGTFRVRGDTVDVMPPYERDKAIRITFLGREIEALALVDALRGTVLKKLTEVSIYPASYYLMDPEKLEHILHNIGEDLVHECDAFKAQGKFLEAQRLEQRTLHDIQMMRELGYCQGVENYSRYLDGRTPGMPPACLLDYFPKDFLLMVDESHVTMPQIGGMYRGDRMRKEVLVDYGFRLSAALDNRPLNFEEFTDRVGQTLYISATPGVYELTVAAGHVVEQIIRPTGLVDPIITIKPATGQIDDLIGEIHATINQKFRVLVTTLTKKMAEEVTAYLTSLKIKVRYLHSEIQSIERMEILKNLRAGEFDVLVGINLLREGLDLPEVALVAILDADKEGFLRSRTSLIQTVGRAARNIQGRAILYANKITESIQACLQETDRRRQKQLMYNEAHGITPQTIEKALPAGLRALYDLDFADPNDLSKNEEYSEEDLQLVRNSKKLEKCLIKLTKEMQKAAQKMEFEEAVRLRDRIQYLKRLEMMN